MRISDRLYRENEKWNARREKRADLAFLIAWALAALLLIAILQPTVTEHMEAEAWCYIPCSALGVR